MQISFALAKEGGNLKCFNFALFKVRKVADPEFSVINLGLEPNVQSSATQGQGVRLLTL